MCEEERSITEKGWTMVTGDHRSARRGAAVSGEQRP